MEKAAGEFYVYASEQQTGPHTHREIGDLLVSKSISQDDLFCPSGGQEWKSIREIFPKEPDPTWLKRNWGWLFVVSSLVGVVVGVLTDEDAKQIGASSVLGSWGGLFVAKWPYRRAMYSHPKMAKRSAFFCGVIGSVTGAVGALLVWLVVVFLIRKSNERK
jgi:hypothetical protein